MAEQRILPLESTIEDSFREFHRDNPDVYRLLVKFAKDAKDAGWEHYGIKGIFERLRWHVHIEQRRQEEFKLNNNYTSRYARLIMEQEPELRDFFELRTLRAL